GAAPALCARRAGGDTKAELDRLPREDHHPLTRETRGDLLRTRGEGERGGALHAVEPAVGETRRVAVQTGREELAPVRADHPAHLEDVGEVARVAPGDHELVRIGVEALDG